MNRNFIFAFALLTILSMANASANFTQCVALPKGPPVLTVKMSPDPMIAGKTTTFNIDGTPSKPVTKDFVLLVGLADSNNEFLATPFTSPIPDGDKINNLVIEFLPPFKLPSSYSIVMAVANTKVEPNDITAWACADVVGKK